MTSSVLLGGLDAVPDPHDPTTVVWKTLKDVEARGKDSPLERISPLRQRSAMHPERRLQIVPSVLRYVSCY